MINNKNNIEFYHGKEKFEIDYYEFQDYISEIEDFLFRNIEKTENLCFLIGSGCSSKAIPMMGNTFNSIKDDIMQRYDEKTLGTFKESKDIEGYLSWLNKAIDFLSEENKDYIKIREYTKKELIKSIAIDYNSDKAKYTLEVYKKFYNTVFKIRRKSKNPINIFTTNYDLFNEKALESLKINYCNGFNGFTERVFEPSVFKQRIVDEENRYKEKWNPLKKYVRLYKIHGSIDWVEKDAKIQQVQKYSEKENILIYPTQAKHFETQYSPYSELFREMNIKLQSSNTTLIILGYGFSDDHINNLIEQSLINEDFNLIILGSLDEEKAKSFFERNNDNMNIHFISGEISEEEKIHYFNVVLSILNREDIK